MTESHQRKTSGKFEDVLVPGSSFEWKFREHLGGYADRVMSVQGDVLDTADRVLGTYFANARFNALFVDASKGWGSNRKLLEVLSPHFVHGGEQRTRILFQDCLYFPGYKLLFLLLALSSLRPAMYVANGCSVVFEVVGDMRAEPIIRDGLSPASLREDDIYAIWKRVTDSFPVERLRTASIVLALPLMLWSCGFKAAAQSEYGRIRLDPQEAAMVRRKMQGSGDKAVRSIPIDDLSK